VPRISLNRTFLDAAAKTKRPTREDWGRRHSEGKRRSRIKQRNIKTTTTCT